MISRSTLKEGRDIQEVSRRFLKPRDVSKDGNGGRVRREVVMVLEEAKERMERHSGTDGGEEEKLKLHG